MAVTFWVTVEVAGVFGKKKAGQWLLAFAVSVVESIFLSQPVKVTYCNIFSDFTEDFGEVKSAPTENKEKCFQMISSAYLNYSKAP